MSEKTRPPKTAHRVEIIRHGRDEMNLVEYPFASLWKNTEPGTEILHEWETTHPRTGKIVKAFWRVTGDPQLGLPTVRDEQLYLVLMELTQATGLTSPLVHFTRHDLIKRLGWSHCQREYDMLRDGFTRLKAVTITSQNAFWDARARSFRITGIALIDQFDILEEQPGRKSAQQSLLPLSFFKWNDVLFDSFQAGYLKALDLTFAQSLDSPLALRLYRYLDKKAFNTRRRFEIELVALCERHLGMRASPYPSKHKERLRPAHEELIARGFLQSVEYEPMKTRKGEKVRYTFAARKGQMIEEPLPEPGPSSESAVAAPVPRAATEDASTPSPVVQSSVVPSIVVQPTLIEIPPEPDPAVTSLTARQEELLQRMLRLKISSGVARGFLQEVAEEEVRLQLDCLQDRDPRDPAATFVRAMQEKWEAPARYLERVEARESAQKLREAQESALALKAAQKAAEGRLKASQELEATQLDALWEQMEPAEREQLDARARERLGVLGRVGNAQGALKAMRRNLMREHRLSVGPGADPDE